MFVKIVTYFFKSRQDLCVGMMEESSMLVNMFTSGSVKLNLT